MLTPHFLLLLLNVAVNLPNPSPQTPNVENSPSWQPETVLQARSDRYSRCRCWRGSGRREILAFEAGRLSATEQENYPTAVRRFVEQW